MCIEFLYKRSYGITPPKTTEKIYWGEVFNIIQFGLDIDSSKIEVKDTYFKLAPLLEYRRMIEYSTVDKRLYVNEFYDCEDFAYALKGEFSIPKWAALPFGMVYLYKDGVYHAMNIFIDSNRQIWIVEPQNDKMFRPSKDFKVEKVEI